MHSYPFDSLVQISILCFLPFFRTQRVQSVWSSWKRRHLSLSLFFWKQVRCCPRNLPCFLKSMPSSIPARQNSNKEILVTNAIAFSSLSLTYVTDDGIEQIYSALNPCAQFPGDVADPVWRNVHIWSWKWGATRLQCPTWNSHRRAAWVFPTDYATRLNNQFKSSSAWPSMSRNLIVRTSDTKELLSWKMFRAVLQSKAQPKQKRSHSWINR